MIVMLYPGIEIPDSDNLRLKVISITDDVDNYNEAIISIVPNLNLKQEWLNLLLRRYQSTLRYDDYLEYSRSKEHYEEDVMRIINDNRIPTIVIDSIDYNIEELISEYMENRDE